MFASIFVLILLIPILAIFLDSDVGKALAKRLERGQRRASGDATHDRLLYLEGELERLAQDVERIEEENQFLQKLLDRRSGGASLPSGDQPDP